MLHFFKDVVVAPLHKEVALFSCEEKQRLLLFFVETLEVSHYLFFLLLSHPRAAEGFEEGKYYFGVADGILFEQRSYSLLYPLG